MLGRTLRSQPISGYDHDAPDCGDDILFAAGDIRDVRPGWRLGRNRLFRGLLLSGRA